MDHCAMCDRTKFRDELISEVFIIDGKRILVENIPARVCVQCGEPVFSSETTEKVRRMVQDEAQPMGVVRMEAYAFPN